MAQLIRTKAGPFTEEDMVTLQDLSDSYWLWKEKKDTSNAELKKYVKPVEEAIPHIPKVWIMDNAIDTVCHGSDLKVPGISKLNSEIKKGDTLGIMSLKDELVALGIAEISSGEIMDRERGVAVKTHKVFLEPGTYPKYTQR